MHIFTFVILKVICIMNRPSLVLKWSLNHSTKVMKIVPIMLHKIRIILSNIKEDLILPEGNVPQNSLMFTSSVTLYTEQLFEMGRFCHKSRRSIDSQKVQILL